MNEAPPDVEATGADYRLIATSALPEVSQVRLYEETWSHIAREHPEFSLRLPSLEHAIADTVINPSIVVRSSTNPVAGYVFQSTDNMKGAYALAVAVKVVEGTSARVATAYFGDPIRGDVLYRRRDVR